MTLAAAEKQELPSRIGGRYRVLAELAAGGMGTVYLAEASGPGGFARLFAVKRIHSHLAGERAFVDMFLDEARITSSCRHPNVCAVHEVGFDGPSPFLAMDYLEGETISAILRKLWSAAADRASPAYPPLMARIIADCCEGLHAAHELTNADGESLEVIHRDVTPQNLLVGYDGAARVLDFGVAKAAGRLHTTRSGAIKGKFAYMSPEQILHKPLDRRSDIWSMGVTFWEALSLGRLFRRDSEGATLHAILSDPIPEPGRPELPIPEELVRIIKRALERDPAARYATAREMASDLNRFLATLGEPVGIAEVSAFMGRIFAKEKKQRRIFLEQARRGRRPTLTGIQVELTPGSNQSPSVSTVNLLGSHSEHTADSTMAEAAGTLPPSQVDTESVSLPIRKAPKIILGKIILSVALLAAAALVGLGIMGLLRLPRGHGDETPENPSSASAPAHATASSAAVEHSPEQPEPSLAGDAGSSVTHGAADAPPESATQSDQAAPTRASGGRTRSRGHRRHRSDPSPSPTMQTAPVAETAPQMMESPAQRSDTPQEPGHVTVATPGGWADITLDGRPAGRSPTVLTVSAGSHSIGLRAFGHSPETMHRVDVASGGRDRVVVRLNAE